MTNLTKLNIGLPALRNPSNLEKAYRQSVLAIDYGTGTPNLEEIVIHSRRGRSFLDSVCDGFDDGVLKDIDLEPNHDAELSCCTRNCFHWTLGLERSHYSELRRYLATVAAT